MNLSVIICTYNRDKYIYNVLKSIAENDFPTADYEIVLVNNNCTDQTVDEVKRFQRDFPEINFCSCIEERQGLSHARNKGIEESSGDILIYVDDDATVNKTYLSAYSTLFKTHPDIYAAGGPIIPTYEDGAEPRWMNYHLKRLLTGYLYFGDKKMPFTGKNYPGGGNAAYRRVVFEKVGQYDPKLGRKGTNLAAGEEKDIFDKMTSAGMKFIYTPDAILYHIIPHYKLEWDYLERVTLGIGCSERARTLAISKAKYCRRLISEIIKWGGTLVLWFYHLLRLNPSSGNRLVHFRFNVTKGLLKMNKDVPNQKVIERDVLLLCSKSDHSMGLFSDIEQDVRVKIEYVELKRPYYKHVQKLVYTLSYFRIHIKMPHWIFQNPLQNLSYSIKYLVVRSTALENLDYSNISFIRQSGVKCILLLLDSVKAGANNIQVCMPFLDTKFWDQIITFDPVDAKQKNWSFIGFKFYSRLQIPLVIKPKYNLYYLGSINGQRRDLMLQVFRHILENNLSVKFDVLVASKDDSSQLPPSIHHFRKSIPYPEVLQHVQNSKCLLEILRSNQSGPSLRYFEAVFYNKKLLTNNPHIVDFPYFNSQYMHVFSQPEEIDFDWLRDDSVVNYHYNGEFSPSYFIDDLLKSGI